MKRECFRKADGQWEYFEDGRLIRTAMTQDEAIDGPFDGPSADLPGSFEKSSKENRAKLAKIQEQFNTSGVVMRRDENGTAIFEEGPNYKAIQRTPEEIIDWAPPSAAEANRRAVLINEGNRIRSMVENMMQAGATQAEAEREVARITRKVL